MTTNEPLSALCLRVVYMCWMRQEDRIQQLHILRMFICASLRVHGMWVAHLFCRIWCSKRMTREMQIYNSIVTCIGSMSSCVCHLYIQPCIWFTRWVLSLLVELDRKQLCVQFLHFFYDPCAALQTMLRPDR